MAARGGEGMGGRGHKAQTSRRMSGRHWGGHVHSDCCVVWSDVVRRVVCPSVCPCVSVR